MEALEIRSSQGPYAVRFGGGIAALAKELSQRPGSVVVVDARVARAHGEGLAALVGARPGLEFEASEEEKTLGGCERILKFLVESGGARDTELIAIGGGIVQDVATLCAHMYFRGIRWTYVPTTLLAMADSCIGAKASINFLSYKNQLGVFHSPGEVRVCLDFLGSLPEDEIRSGYGEIFKLHLVSSPRAFRELDRTVAAEGMRGPSLGAAIRSSLEIKRGFIEEDEFDRGRRRILNYGHTFGHALESVTNHAIPHGLAVAWGMDLVNFLAMRQGRLGEALFGEIHAVLARHFGWRLKAAIPLKALVEATRRDKKSLQGRMNLVMPDANGVLDLVRQDYTELLLRHIEEYIGGFSIVRGP